MQNFSCHTYTHTSQIICHQKNIGARKSLCVVCVLIYTKFGEGFDAGCGGGGVIDFCWWLDFFFTNHPPSFLKIFSNILCFWFQLGCVENFGLGSVSFDHPRVLYYQWLILLILSTPRNTPEYRSLFFDILCD